jgi:hypothetical protein
MDRLVETGWLTGSYINMQNRMNIYAFLIVVIIEKIKKGGKIGLMMWFRSYLAIGHFFSNALILIYSLLDL